MVGIGHTRAPYIRPAISSNSACSASLRSKYICVPSASICLSIWMTAKLMTPITIQWVLHDLVELKQMSVKRVALDILADQGFKGS